MEIPESAREAGISAMHSLPEVYWAREGATAAVAAAAPHIARQAQVQILREWILDINLRRYETPEQIAKATHVRMEWLKLSEANELESP